MSQILNDLPQDAYRIVDPAKVIKEAESLLATIPGLGDVALTQAVEAITTTTLRSGVSVAEMLESLAADAVDTAKKKKEQKRITELQRVLEQILAREQQRGPAIEQDRSSR